MKVCVVDILVQVSGIAFMGEGGEERKVIGDVPFVDVDYIFRSIVYESGDMVENLL